MSSSHGPNRKQMARAEEVFQEGLKELFGKQSWLGPEVKSQMEKRNHCLPDNGPLSNVNFLYKCKLSLTNG